MRFTYVFIFKSFCFGRATADIIYVYTNFTSRSVSFCVESSTPDLDDNILVNYKYPKKKFRFPENYLNKCVENNLVLNELKIK